LYYWYFAKKIRQVAEHILVLVVDTQVVVVDTQVFVGDTQAVVVVDTLPAVVVGDIQAVVVGDRGQIVVGNRCRVVAVPSALIYNRHNNDKILFKVSNVFSFQKTNGCDSSYRLNFDQGKKNEIQHHS
jgi:hypothetical protein